jgi:hypothetical protein
LSRQAPEHSHTGSAWAYVVSDTDEPGILLGVAAIIGYAGAMALLGLWCRPRIAFGVVLAESATATIIGIATGGFDNEAWGLSIITLTVIAVVILATVAVACTVRSSHRSWLSSPGHLRRRE